MRLTVRSHRREPGPRPHRGGRRGDVRAHLPDARHVAGQFALIAGAALAYFAVRDLTQGSVSTALAHARDVLSAERALGVDWEPAIQDVVVDHSWLTTATNWVYIWGHWPAIGLTLLWLYLRHPAYFRSLRNAMFISGAIGLVIFATFPVAPPRLAGIGAIDTVTLHSQSYRTLQPPGLINRYAAMPSLHFGWNLLVGITVLRASRHAVARCFGVVLPIAMGLSVVGTGNHFTLDVLAGAIVALAGLALVPLAARVTARPPRNA